MKPANISKLAQLATSLALCTIITVSLSVPAAAQQSWAVAQRDGAAIASFVGKLMPYVDGLADVDKKGGAVLYRQHFYDLDEKNSKRCQNFMVLVKDPAKMPAAMSAPRFSSGWDLVESAAFVMRGNDVTKLDLTSIVHTEGLDGIGRDQVVFSIGDLKKGDVVGWSLVLEREGPVPGMFVPCTDVFPSVITNLKIRTDHRFAYDIRSTGMKVREMDHKESEAENGRPGLLQATVRAMPAVESMPADGRYGDSFPHVEAYLHEMYIESEHGPALPGWVPILGWNQTAAQLHGIVKKFTEDAPNMDITLGAITTGAQTAQERERAVFENVRDKYELLKGDDIQDSGFREITDVIKAKNATAAEKAMLMAVMLKKLEIPVSLAVARSSDLGPVNRKVESWLQFDTLVVRCPGDGDNPVRYYAPACATCEPGTLPPGIGDTLFTTVDDVGDLIEAFGKKIQQRAINDGTISLGGVSREREEQSWYKFDDLASQ